MKMCKSILAAVLMAAMLFTTVFSGGMIAGASTDIGSAKTISVNKSYSGKIQSGYASEQDYYKFKTTNNGYVTVFFTNTQPSTTSYEAWRVTLYKYKDNALTIIASKKVYTDERSVSLTSVGLPAGTYYINVRSEGYWDAISTSTYKVNANFKASGYWEKEFNEDFGSATRLPSQQKYTGTTVEGYFSEQDYYKFTTTSQGTIKVRLYNTDVRDSSDNIWTLYVLDSAGNYIGWDSLAWEESSVLVQLDGRPAGTYYACVQSYNYENPISTSKYQIKVSGPGIPLHSFTDVKKSSWYYSAVQYVAKKGYITGYESGAFKPAAKMQRQDFVVVLARVAGANLSKYANSTGGFKDVKKGSYYAPAVAWAVDKGIVTGYNSREFGVGDSLTREQVATILYRYKKSPSVSNVNSTLSQFSDRSKIGSYAKTAAAWAAKNDIITGKGNKFAPKEAASRAQIAAIIMRMDQQGMF